MKMDRGVVLRPWREDDAEALAQLANDRSIWLGLRDKFPHPYGIDDARSFIALAGTMPGWFAVEVEGRLAGGIGVTPRTDVERVGAEVGYWIGASFRGQGVATSALRLLSAQAFRMNPELRRLFAVPYATNRASGRVLEKAGYRLEGTLRQSAIKDGKILDQWMYSLLRDEVPESA